MVISKHLIRDQGRAGRKVTLIGAVANLFLIALKLIAGVFGHSHALIADAVHSVSDLFTDAVVLVGLKLGRKAPDEGHPYGHGRLETLSSAIVGLGLLGAAFYLGTAAGLNIYTHDEHHPTGLALGAAGLSIVIKEALYRYTIRIGRSIKSSALVANAWHHRSDAFSSVAVLLGVVGALIKPSWYILDSYAALVVSFLIAKVGFDILWRCVREFIDSAPGPETLVRIRTCVFGVKGVIDVHDVKVRTSGGLYQMGLHVVIDGNLSVSHGHRIAKDVEKCLDEEFELGEVIVHVDPSSG